MKSRTQIFILALALTFGACAPRNTNQDVASQSPQPETTEQLQQRIDETKVSTHPCGAITKAGKPCTRKVTNGDYTDTAVEMRCWQHRKEQEKGE